MSAVVKNGMRVVRGPDWKWGTQDSGEGHVATVVDVESKVVEVLWDTGTSNQYRIGAEGKYDLRCLDTAQSGVVHPNINCDGCQTKGVRGMRWKCTSCYDYDLCSTCYFGDKHDINHTFLRFDSDTTTGVLVPKRAGSTKRQSRGIFTGAKVKRGRHWEWGNQDGGGEKVGTVKEIRPWSSDGARDAARVTWPWVTNNYRVGVKGKVDLACVTAASGYCYYRDHLPVLGKKPDSSSSHDQVKVGDLVRIDLDAAVLKAMQEGHGGWHEKMATIIGKIGRVKDILDADNVRVKFGEIPVPVNINAACLTKTTTTVKGEQMKAGDKVSVNLEPDVVEGMQEGHGGWSDNMAKSFGQTGIVERVLDNGDVKVRYGNTSWVYNPAALTKENDNMVKSISVGDYVKIADNVETAKRLQKSHGGWTDHMALALGKVGKVKAIDDDGDLQVLVDGRKWFFNPAACTPVSEGEQEVNNMANDDEEEEDSSMDVVDILRALLSIKGGRTSSHPDMLVQHASEGNLDAVREILASHPECVGIKNTGKTALHLASCNGHVGIVKVLLDAGANLESTDDNGVTVLSYAASENQVEVTELLLKRGANVNALNNRGHSALQIAVAKKSEDTVKILIARTCNVNIQDEVGDTPLHDAITQSTNEIVTLLLAHPGVDLSIINERGFNVLHWAVLRGNDHATEMILQKSRQLVDIKKEDGFSALHLAVFNKHLQLTDTLLTTGKADIEVRNSDQQSPLHLACQKGFKEGVELLVSKGANVSAVDKDGDTPLHITLMVQTLTTQVLAALGMSDSGTSMDMIAQFLCRHGAPLDKENQKGQSAMDLVSNQPMKDILLSESSAATKRATARQLSQSAKTSASQCLICSVVTADIIFDPCGHKITCSGCCRKVKKCLSCQTRITKKRQVAADDAPGQMGQDRNEITGLRKKMTEMEETINCSLCCERPKTTAFMCGHRTCDACSRRLTVCHICRKPITQRIKLFN